MPTVSFVIRDRFRDVTTPPRPASTVMPEWLRKLPKEPKGPLWPLQSVKACSPFIDATIAGYIVGLPCTMKVYAHDGVCDFDWLGDLDLASGFGVDQHSEWQLEGSGHTAIYKFLSPWAVDLPRGYSALFTQPVNHDLPFRIFSGVVDDPYKSPLNFPFVWTAGDGEFELAAGSPLAQVIPFRREPWTFNTRAAPRDDILRSGRAAVLMRNGYRNLFHRQKRWT